MDVPMIGVFAGIVCAGFYVYWQDWNDVGTRLPTYGVVLLAAAAVMMLYTTVAAWQDWVPFISEEALAARQPHQAAIPAGQEPNAPNHDSTFDLVPLKLEPHPFSGGEGVYWGAIPGVGPDDPDLRTVHGAEWVGQELWHKVIRLEVRNKAPTRLEDVRALVVASEPEPFNGRLPLRLRWESNEREAISIAPRDAERLILLDYWMPPPASPFQWLRVVRPPADAWIDYEGEHLPNGSVTIEVSAAGVPAEPFTVPVERWGRR